MAGEAKDDAALGESASLGTFASVRVVMFLTLRVMSNNDDEK